MRTTPTLLAAPLILILGLATSARAQDRHAVAASTLAAAVQDHAATLDADRDAIREALSRPEVRAVAERTGLGRDLDRAAASIDTLDSSTLARAAESARQVNHALAGGASTVTISTTTIIIVLLLIILILVAA